MFGVGLKTDLKGESRLLRHHFASEPLASKPPCLNVGGEGRWHGGGALKIIQRHGASPLCDHPSLHAVELQASRSEALNNKLACCWRSFSFSPQPQEWPLKPWTPRFLHPAEAPAAIFKKREPKCRCGERGNPPRQGGVRF